MGTWVKEDQQAKIVLKLLHKIFERLGTEDFFREIDADLCQYAYAFRESGVTSSINMKYCLEQDFQSLSERKSLHYGLLNFKCLMTNHATFDTQMQLEYVSASSVHAYMQAMVC